MKNLKVPHLHKRGLIVVIALVMAAGMALAYSTFASSGPGIDCYWYLHNSGSRWVGGGWVKRKIQSGYRDRVDKEVKTTPKYEVRDICKQHKGKGSVYYQPNYKGDTVLPAHWEKRRGRWI